VHQISDDFLLSVAGSIRPATTMVVVAPLVDPRWRLEMEAEAIVGSA
jgi:enamine deaminase RidA (YjgF/YER057c/UK114 family)